MKSLSMTLLIFLLCGAAFADSATFNKENEFANNAVAAKEKASTDTLKITQYSNQATSDQERYRKENDALMVNPLPTIVGLAVGYPDIVLEGQTAFSKTWTLASIGEFGTVSGVHVLSLQVGPQFRPFGSYLNGFLIGLYPGVGYLTDYLNWIWFFSITGETGYQWVLDSGVVLGLTTGFSYFTVNPYLSGIKWNIGADIGFAFADPFIKAN